MDGVVLLHGLANRRFIMGRLQGKLRADGFRTLNIGYPSRSRSIDALATKIAPEIEAFAEGFDGRLHFVTHSMGGLVARAWIARARPNCRIGRVVMLGPPNGGSEIVDALGETRIFRAIFGPAVGELTTRAARKRAEALGPPDYQVGVIAGDRSINPIASGFLLPRPSDGAVSVEGTRLQGMADHLVVPVAHSLLPLDRRVIAQAENFLRRGAFAR